LQSVAVSVPFTAYREPDWAMNPKVTVEMVPSAPVTL
jgi:hypothetical protein